ncbi:MAG: hypothetical protein RLN89_07740 [Parvibaculum sp.]
MSAETTKARDEDQALGLRILAALAVVSLLLILGTYFLGAGFLLVAAIGGTAVMLVVLTLLSAPNRKA